MSEQIKNKKNFFFGYLFIQVKVGRRQQLLWSITKLNSQWFNAVLKGNWTALPFKDRQLRKKGLKFGGCLSKVWNYDASCKTFYALFRMNKVIVRQNPILHQKEFKLHQASSSVHLATALLMWYNQYNYKTLEHQNSFSRVRKSL